ncbi:TetR/AcrR family transcriptional regulator [Oleispirillum naphthae]|uniref:TetR/AcrR family transcriptional regulator n=1 Tax=Oleispirillum naphthae TaxID=2838853 RepID=UPI0030826838
MDKPLSARIALRRQAMLAAGRAVFLEKGFERTTLSDIVTRSGGSRSTLIGLFGSKAGLFAEVMQEGSLHISYTFDFLGESDTPPQEALRDFARRFVAALFDDPFAIAFLRILIAEGPRFPELGQAFLRLGPDTRDRKLGAYFQRCIDKGLLHPHDPVMLSQIFCGMVIGDSLIRHAIGEDMTAQMAQMQAHADAAVEIFLAGVLAPGGAAG